MSEPPSQNDGSRDVERAVAELAERLPQPLLPLARLVYNYRWSWMSGAAALFRTIDPAVWRHSECNPRYVIESVRPSRLQELAQQEPYVRQVQETAARLEADLRRPAAPGPFSAERPIAYFCSEFGVHCSLPLYGGGLGVLAGDLLKAASDLAVPLLGVGLLYREGYFHQRLDPSGWQHEYWTPTNFERLPAVLVTGQDDKPLTIDVAIRSRQVHVQVWRISVGRVPLYLLDTDREDNHPIDRWITARLYVGDRFVRLAQYALLGIGGARMLNALGIHPGLVHLNEGHAALSSFERMRQLTQNGMALDDALQLVRQETIFTTHTPVPAGNEGYHEAEVEPVLGEFIEQSNIPRALFYDLGRLTPGAHDQPVSITPLALRTSRAANGVAQRHGEVARAMWQPLWPERAVNEVPIAHVTNGVHTATWMASPMQALFDQHLGEDWRRRLGEPGFCDRIAAIPDQDLWRVRCQQRETLVQYAREQSIRDRISRGEPSDYVAAAASVFDPNVFTVGFARRVATYKRMYLLARPPEMRFLQLLADGPRPLQLVLAGKAHPQDNDAKHTLLDRFQQKNNPNVARRVVFLEDYDLHMAPRIVSGVDLWLNLPRPPLEASGTSGMKVTLNGGLNLSVLDGWWAEAYNGENGWAITSPDTDPHTQDEHDAHALVELLEQQVIPLFYQRDADSIPHGWLQRVKTAMRTLIPRFTAERMLTDYLRTMYTAAPSQSP